jgi:hypothetical protein
MKKLNYVNPYTWESESAARKGKNKRRGPPGMTAMDRSINKMQKREPLVNFDLYCFLRSPAARTYFSSFWGSNDSLTLAWCILLIFD